MKYEKQRLSQNAPLECELNLSILKALPVKRERHEDYYPDFELKHFTCFGEFRGIYDICFCIIC